MPGLPIHRGPGRTQGMSMKILAHRSERAREGLDDDALVSPIINHGYQFSAANAVVDD